MIPRSLLIGLALAAAYVVVAFQSRWVSDDAFITFRVVEQVLAGNGPVYNVGERVEAYSHPFWLLLLTLWSRLFGSVEMGSVVMGLTFATAAIAIAGLAPRNDRRLLPFGALLVVALPPFWEYATSGLETGLAFAWMAIVYALSRRTTSPVATYAVAFVAGLGVLIRPDLGLFVVAFLLMLMAGRSARRRMLLAASALAVPLLHELFRMGYYAAVVATPAIAKEASIANWSQGVRYLGDTVATYWLAVPLLLLIVGAATGRMSRRDPSWLLIGAALLHLLFVVRVGGGFMHARLLLPGLFALALPFWFIEMRGERGPRWAPVALVGAMVVWAVFSAGWLRVPYRGDIGAAGIADERGYYARLAGVERPITIEDYREHIYENQGEVLAHQATLFAEERFRDQFPRGAVVIDLTDDPADAWVDFDRQTVMPIAANVPPACRLVAGRWNVGLAGYAAGVDVHIVDRRGLADPIAARLALTRRGRPGHEKELSNTWILARFADLPSQAESVPEVQRVRRALGRDDVGRLLTAISEPLTARRFMTNVAIAWPSTRLRIRDE